MHSVKANQNPFLAAPVMERYVATVLIVVCTVAIRLVLDPMLGVRAPYMFFFFTVVIVTHLWGRGPGLVATFLGGVAAWYFLLEPQFSFALGNRFDTFNLAAYFAVGTGISILGGKSRSLPGLGIVAGKPPKVRWARQTMVLAIAAGVLAGMVLLLQRDFRRSQNAQRWVAHTYQVINSAESLLSLVGEAESGVRGFLLTGDDRELAPYTQASTATPAELEKLRILTSDNPAQVERCRVIKVFIGERLGFLGRIIDLRKASQAQAAIGLVRSGGETQPMKNLRSAVDEVVEEEHGLLKQRTAAADMEDSRERWVLGLGSGTLILLLILASTVIEWETVKRERITQALSRHANLLEQAHDSLLTCRLRGAIQYWSRGAEILFGYTAQEAVGKSSHELLLSQHLLGIEQIDALLERDGEWNGELTQTAKDGRSLTVEAKWTLAVDVDGKKLVLEAHRDVTEHKRAEAQNRLLATAIEQAEETVVITDRFANIQYANPAFARTTGYTRDEALGQNPRVLKSGQHDAKFYQGLWSALTTGKLWRGEFTNRRKDGTLYMEQAAIAPVRNASGEITNYIAIKSDITERKLAEEALKQSEQLLRESQRVGRIGSYDLDIASGCWSSSATLDEIFGIESDYARDVKGWLALMRPGVAQNMAAYLQEIMAQKKRFDMDYQIVRAGDRVERWVSGKGEFVLDAQFQPVRLIGTIQDITERKQAEQELHQLNVQLENRVRARTADLESANRELEAFAHSVSHDLRAPLRGIDGWSLALLEDCGELLDEQGRKYLDRVRSEAQHMGRLIDDLLHLSRVSRRELVPITVDLTSLASTLVGRLKEANPGRSIECVVQPNLSCVGDPRLLEIALTNLLNNAAKFTGKCSSARVEFSETVFEGAPAFFVRDNGVGFDMAYAGLLFSPFQRLHKASEFPGTGIGLATVQRVIHRHGGRIWAQALVGEGATFFFTLGANKV